MVAGGIETLALHRPTVLFEHGLPAALSYGAASCDLWDSLSGDCGLEIYALDGHGPYSRTEFSGPMLCWNFIAVRPELQKLVTGVLHAAGDVEAAGTDLTIPDDAR